MISADVYCRVLDMTRNLSYPTEDRRGSAPSIGLLLRGGGGGREGGGGVGIWDRILLKDFGCGITKKGYPAPSATPPPVAMTNLFIIIVLIKR